MGYKWLILMRLPPPAEEDAEGAADAAGVTVSLPDDAAVVAWMGWHLAKRLIAALMIP